MSIIQILASARQKLLRDKSQPWHQVAQKSLRYGWELASAPLFLRAVDQVGRGVRTLGKPRIENFGTMTIGDYTLIRSVNVPVELCTGPEGTLCIGRAVRLNYGVSIGATGSIEIGDRVRVGPYAMIVDTDFHDPYVRSLRPPPRPVVIEDDAWIGAKVSILPGVRIGKGAIIGTGAVVTRDVPAFTVVGGVPAKVIRELDPTRFVPEEVG